MSGIKITTSADRWKYVGHLQLQEIIRSVLLDCL